MRPPAGATAHRVAPPAAGACSHDHRVEFYETEAFLVDTVHGFLAPALQTSGAVVVVATAEHRAAFCGALERGGMDVDALVSGGRLVLLDAAELLRAFMDDDGPDEERFRAAVLPALDLAAGSQDGDGRAVRVYGEMVALLWRDGRIAAALALEELWNGLAGQRTFELLCAYPTAAFERPGLGDSFERLCAQHSAVIPSEAYSLLTGADERARMVARLQQEVAALRGELTVLRDDRAELAELAFVDALTGLANRRAFDRDLEREWQLSLRDGVDSYVVVADLDDFKAINDHHGHAAGDEVLRQVASAMRAAARKTDIVARIGGDEFAVLLMRCDERASHSFKARLLEATTAIDVVPGMEVTVTLGHAALQQSISAAAAVERADRAMLAHKRARG